MQVLRSQRSRSSTTSRVRACRFQALWAHSGLVRSSPTGGRKIVTKIVGGFVRRVLGCRLGSFVADRWPQNRYRDRRWLRSSRFRVPGGFVRRVFAGGWVRLANPCIPSFTAYGLLRRWLRSSRIALLAPPTVRLVGRPSPSRGRSSIRSSFRPIGAICSSEVARQRHGRNGSRLRRCRQPRSGTDRRPEQRDGDSGFYARIGTVDLLVIGWLRNARLPDLARNPPSKPRRSDQPMDGASPRAMHSNIPHVLQDANSGESFFSLGRRIESIVRIGWAVYRRDAVDDDRAQQILAGVKIGFNARCVQAHFPCEPRTRLASFSGMIQAEVTVQRGWGRRPEGLDFVFRKAVIFSELGLILYSDHDLIPCIASARLTRAVPALQEERHDTSPL